MLLIIPFICLFFFHSKQIFCYKFLIFYESQSSNFVCTLRVAKYIGTENKTVAKYIGAENKTAEIYFFFFFLFSISHSNVIYIGKFETNISQELLHVEFCNLVQMLWIICCFMWKKTRLLLLILPLISSSPIFKYQIISSLFSQGLRGLQSWNLVHTWTLGWCIMYTWIRLLVFIYSFISSIFFLSNSKTLNFLSHFYVRPSKLKLDTHLGNGLIYCIHQIQAARIYLFLYFLLFFCLSN